jgi:glycosyltransferase involved in cell wall biosynthesis
MKIYHILQGVGSPSAGPAYSVGALAHQQAIHGNEVEVIALGSYLPEWPYSAKLNIFWVKWPRALLGRIQAISFIRDVASEPAILHGHGVWRVLDLFPLALRSSSPSRIIWSPRGMFSEWSWQQKAGIKRPFWHLFQKPAFKRVNCFHATAMSEYHDVRRVGFSEPVAVIPNAVDVPPLNENIERKNRIVFLSRIHPKKGLDILIPAWRQVAELFPDWELVIAGPLDSPYANRMVKMAHELEVPRLRFHGEVLGDEKSALLFSSRLFVLPTYSENFGLVIAEALAHGIPVITTTETPWTNVNQQGCGWCIRPDRNELVEALTAAMSESPGKLESMGRRGRAWMEKDYSWPHVADEMKSVYQWLLNGGTPPDCVITD